MKLLKFIIPCLTLILILALTPACASAEPEVPEEPIAEESVPEEELSDEEITVEEPEEEAVEGEPELVWSYKHENNLESVATAPDGETVTIGEYLTTYTHQLYDGSIIDVNTYRHSAEDLGYSLDGSIIGVGLVLYGVVLTDTTDGSELFQLHDGYNNRLAFSPDGEHVATGNREGVIWIWRLEDGQQVVALENPEVAEKAVTDRWVTAIDYHPTGMLLAATHNDGSVYIWDMEEESIVRTLNLDVLVALMSNSFRFSPDGEVMAGAVQENFEYMVRLWTVDNTEQILDLSFPKLVSDIAFSPDGSLLAVSSLYQETTIWEVSTGALLYTLDQKLDPSTITDGSLATVFTPDGGHLAVVRNDGTLELWRLPGAEPIEAPPVDMQEPPPIPGDVLFDTGSAELKGSADTVLEELATDLYAELPEARITFIGHTDSRGESGYNLQLSIDRATAVKDWFDNWAEENGADGWELLVDGRGSSELKVPDTDVEGTFLEDAGALNRRVEIEIETDN